MITSTAPRIAATDAAPIAGHERLAHVDVLRGFALFGILLVNMALFKAPAIVQAAAPMAPNGKAPLLPAQLRQAIDALPDTLLGKRDHALLVMALRADA